MGVTVAELFDHVRRTFEGRYEVERVLGSGGAAIVFLATDTHTSRKVAIKVLRPEVAGLLGHERFQREIRIASTLVHAHVLPLHDAGEIDGLFYYVMPFVEEQTLRGRLARDGPLSVPDAVRIARELAAALTYAHERGVVHRDVKPGNIFLTHSHAILGDFGVATALASAGAEDLTATGSSIGTLAYMSPEQIDGAAVDHRSDLYSLGCVLFEMLTGEPPYGRGVRPSVLAGHAAGEPPELRDRRPDAPEAVARLVDECLRKRPDERLQTASEFERRLEAPMEGHVARRRPPAPRHRVRVVAGVAAGVLAIAALGVALARTGGSALDEGTFVVLPVRAAAWGQPLDEAAWALAREITRELSQWEGVRAVPQVALAGPIFDLGRDDRTPGTLEDARAVARSLGAGALVVLDARLVDDSLDVDVIRVDPRRGTVLGRTSRGRGPAARPAELAASIALELVGLVDADLGAAHPFRYSGSPEAIRAFEEGRRALDRWELPASRTALERAVELDPDFALAHHYLALALYWEGATGGQGRMVELGPAILRHSTRARDRGSDLPDREQRHVDAFHAFIRGDFAEARAEYERLLAETPTDSYAHLLLGSVEFRDRMIVERAEGARPRADWNRAIASFEAAVRLSPDFSLGYGHLFDVWSELSHPLQCPVFWPEPDASILLWESKGFDDIRPFCPVLRDSIGWAPITEREHPDHGDGRLLRLIETSTHRQLERWAAYAPDQARPLEELTRWTLLLRTRLPSTARAGSADSLGAQALAFQSAALAIRTDTTDYDRMHLAALRLAAGDPAAALRLAEDARTRRGGRTAGADFAAHPYLAAGRTTEAIAEVTAAYRGNRLAAITSSGSFVPFGEAEPVVFTVQVLGANGAPPAATRPVIERLLDLWSSETLGAEASSALRAAAFGRVAPALLQHDDLLEAWFAGLGPTELRDPALADFWTGWREIDVDRAAARAALDTGLRALDATGASPTAIYLYGSLAAELDEHTTALELWERLQLAALPVLGEFHPGWALRNLALLRSAETHLAQGRRAEARSALDRLEQRWQSAEPAVSRLLTAARAQAGL